MRITNGMMQRSALAQLQTGMQQVSKAQDRVSSGLKIQRPSDDPAGASAAMDTRSSLRALEQYQRNVDGALSRLSAEEGTLSQLGDVITRAKELGLSQMNSSASPETRAYTKIELDGLLDHAISLANTSYKGEYLFGGQWPDQKPFDPEQTGTAPSFVSIDDDTGAPRAPAGVPATEIGAGRYLQASHDGEQVFLDTGVLQALKDLSDALASADPIAEIGSAVSKLDSSFQGVQTLLGDVGGRTNQLELTRSNLDAFDINLQTLKSDIEEADLEVAISDLVSRQTAFQAAMLATSRVMGLTLADYLR